MLKADLNVYLFGNRQSVLDLDSEISDSALQLCMTEQELDSADVPLKNRANTPLPLNFAPSFPSEDRRQDGDW